ncbi:MAG TPA: hypothetical protein VFC14_12625 [Burkholderiales bacterium]|jgi:hypothetical protein|nr:hypothetical protein [Burkholderiales bacterium]
MDGVLEIFLALAMAAVAGASVTIVVHRIAARGRWAAGYWWTDQDRRHGPGT